MNNPEYIVVDEFGLKNNDDLLTGGILYNVKQKLVLPVLNYQYGTIEELNQTLQSWSETATFNAYKFPLVFILQPFKITRGFENYFGRLTGLRLFIINKTEADYKAKDRMTNNFKPVIYPIYREMLRQIDLSVPFTGTKGQGVQNIPHSVIDMYYWNEMSQRFLNDIVDTMVVDEMQLNINHNPNCSNFKSF